MDEIIVKAIIETSLRKVLSDTDPGLVLSPVPLCFQMTSCVSIFCVSELKIYGLGNI